MKTPWVWWKSQLSPHWTHLSPTTQIPLLGMHPQLLNTIAMRLRLMHLDSITVDQRSRFLNKNCLWPFVPLVQLISYKVKDSFEYSGSGLNVSMIKRSALPKGVITKLLGDTKLVKTFVGCLKMQEVLTMQDLKLPEFDKNRRINQQKVFCVWQWQCQIQHHPGYKLFFQDWNKVELLRRKHGMVWLFHPTLSTWRFGFKCIQCNWRHVSHPSQRWALWWRLAQMLCNQDSGCQVYLLQVLQEKDNMFDGTLGIHPRKKVHIDIDPNAKPVHSRPYPVPWIHLKTLKTDLDHLLRIGVLASQQESE